mgnify:CR=1 FL=1
MGTKINVYLGIAGAFALIGLVSVLVSIFADHSEHNYALAIGLG